MQEYVAGILAKKRSLMNAVFIDSFLLLVFFTFM